MHIIPVGVNVEKSSRTREPSPIVPVTRSPTNSPDLHTPSQTRSMNWIVMDAVESKLGKPPLHSGRDLAIS